MITSKPGILCVDDEPSNLKILEAILTPRGYEVLPAESGTEALEIINKQKVDIVLLDVMMPGVSGYDVCKRVKEDERCRNIPVVMVTALTSKEERIKGIEAGAEDFISKPFDHTELLTRIKMLLKMKDLRDSLDSAYAKITALSGFGARMAMSFDPLNFNFISSFDNIVNHIIRKTSEMSDKPQIVVVGFIDENNNWQWYQFESISSNLKRTWLKLDIHNDLGVINGDNRVCHYNEADLEGSNIRAFTQTMASRAIKVSNVAGFVSNVFCVLALNHNKVVSRYDAEVLNSIAVQSLFFKSLSSQVKETENAFDYLVHAMARAAEANDEDTGNHILRVGEYCAIVAKEIGMSEKFTGIIRIQATLHDVGKIHVHPDILKKPGKFTPEEYENMKKHTIYGAKILGDHVRLTLARKACLSHHERWDGGGYPHALKGEQISVEGRILNIADQYDALRNARVYKPAFDHQKTYGIITEGDGRTMPHHFDPQVLRAFKETASQFEEVYERMKG
ncbi:MAG: response regulator [Nitrospirota bacterium]